MPTSRPPQAQSERGTKRRTRRTEQRNETHLLQTLFIHRHLDGDVREALVDGFVGARLERGVVFAVGVEVRDGADTICDG